MIIAIDGPAGSGKSTIAKLVALELGFEYLDTGAMYRMVTLRLVNKKISLEDIRSIEKELKNMKIDILNNRFFLNNVDVTDEIRTPIVSENVSKVAKIKEIRYKMVELQREISKSKNTILDGRDIGTVVFPNAEIKIYLIADEVERAKRRYSELKNNSEISFEDVLKNIIERDRIDSTRVESPLKKAEDAIEIDTTGNTIEEVKEKILLVIEEYKNKNLSQ
ncbi:MAG: (d)CMP kinase [Leptotrichiaceae bacterium]|jgi:CMP/dCMP kinase|nr:(d)CMP kinase [Leptotrichiaceae bacterium]MBP6168251.1 (d)CMP kinase [Leptotrichiaceae bacterium]MBP7026360.1 (d)CMP kinase [Leptotrichiaceae bacterium]MBP8637022.1 (d)CMP kinase [Leptotrichiaceae bacterium]MBP9538884.1 (d)CMP kinase [Leptotrichiaceae bacterium]